MSYSSTVLQNWDHFLDLINGQHTQPITVTGTGLDLASITAIARYGRDTSLSRNCLGRVTKSADDVATHLEAGDTIYAVNTGVGASAGTRTTAVDDLQQAIIKTLNCGIMDGACAGDAGHEPAGHLLDTAPLRDGEELETLPLAWVKAAQLVRINSLAGGNSGVRLETLRGLEQLLRANIVPKTPLRGSISASGDLSPLAYLAGALQGNPGIDVWTRSGQSWKLTTAEAALREAQITPVKYAPKEALALANGTSVSAAAAALALHEAHGGMALAQVLTAMAVEALTGTEESFDAHIAAVRPHPGQMEAARNVRSFLRGSRLARKADTQNADGLRQDRYALRTAPQWLGPELESMGLAHAQVVTECNSITDNPLVKPDGRVLQGGNFQAQAVTAAMDRTRAALHSAARLLFHQAAELMNPATSNGLPPNLTADEPSHDFLLKGSDIASAAYTAELAFLAHGTTPFVMAAELGNQSLNSMALMSARYTHKALDVYMQLCANALLAACQALDLRAVHARLEAELEPLFAAQLARLAGGWLSDAGPLRARLWSHFCDELRQRTTLDRADRFAAAIRAVRAVASDAAQDSCPPDVLPDVLAGLRAWASEAAPQAAAISARLVDEHMPEHTLPLLGRAARRMYDFVRRELGVPFLRGGDLGPQNVHTFKGAPLGSTIGTFATRIYRSLRSGGLMVPVMESLREATLLDAEEAVAVAAPEPIAPSPVSPARPQAVGCHTQGSIIGKRERRVSMDANDLGLWENAKRVRA